MHGTRYWNAVQRHGSIRPNHLELETAFTYLAVTFTLPFLHISLPKFSKKLQRDLQPPLPVDPSLHSRAPPVPQRLPYS